MITGKFAPKETFCKVSMNKCIMGKFFQEFFTFLMNGERLSFGTVYA